MEYHATGLSWNPKVFGLYSLKWPVQPLTSFKGISLSEYKALPATGGAPPPPPPPPPPPASDPPPPPASGSGGGVAAVFAELNRGADVTKGLRKVEKSEMTHKNPALRASSTVPSNTSPSLGKKPTKPVKPQSLSTKKPAKFALEGKKWIIVRTALSSASRVRFNGTILGVPRERASPYDRKWRDQPYRQFIWLQEYYRCDKGQGQRCNSRFVNRLPNRYHDWRLIKNVAVNCKKTSVLVDSVISSVSVTASPSFTIQITGSAPTIQLDSTDSGQIYLSKDCLGVEIFTAKCSAINVSLPVEGEEEGVFEEKPIPEMFRTTVQNGALVTGIVEHSG